MDGTNKSAAARNKMLLDSYKITMEGLAAYYGDSFEIVLHDLTDLNHSIIKIINGFHSGREEGAPITDFALSVLEKIKAKTANANKKMAPYMTYYSSSKHGKPVKSTTIVIFGVNNEAIGLLCINFYLDSPISSLAGLFGSSSISPAELVNENFVSNSDELVEKALQKVKSEVMNDSTIPAVLKNKEIVTQLYYQGVFKLKNAVSLVAENLLISKNTVYLHIRPLEKKE
ncbi:MAG: PAS domain-containing protein [Treponema sp.]|jgi:predicted transcriptional regulator YheO|nr:PAS domain-containing protein [Treponema sp.]